MEMQGYRSIRASCMLSQRSTIRATSPHVLTVYLISISCQMSSALCHWLPRTQKPTAACMHACYRPSATTASRVHIVVDDRRVHAAVAGELMQCRSSKRLTKMLQVQGPLVSQGVLISAKVLHLARKNKRFTWIILVFTYPCMALIHFCGLWYPVSRLFFVCVCVAAATDPLNNFLLADQLFLNAMSSKTGRGAAIHPE